VSPVRIVKAALVVLAVTLTALTAGCAKSPNFFLPESPQGRDIATLGWEIFIILSVVLLSVWGILIAILIKDRKRPESQVKQTHGNLKIEIIWTAIPAVIVAVLFVLTLQAMNALSLPSGTPNLTVVSHQWWWELDYGPGAFRSANEMHVPLDRETYATVTSVDVIHSFWVPQLDGKIDMIPGRYNKTSFVPTKVGTYLGECSEFCGHQHGRMRFLVFVEPIAKFTAWYKNQTLPSRRPSGAQATAGLQYMKTSACAGCHAIRGAGLNAKVAPDLTHLASRTTIAAVTLKNTPENLKRWIRDPQKVKPGNKMPTVPLTAKQLDQVVAYLDQLK
jgi:cytochrome c oxidase subunit II